VKKKYKNNYLTEEKRENCITEILNVENDKKADIKDAKINLVSA
jgi:hypothetical protein